MNIWLYSLKQRQVKEIETESNKKSFKQFAKWIDQATLRPGFDCEYITKISLNISEHMEI